MAIKSRTSQKSKLKILFGFFLLISGAALLFGGNKGVEILSSSFKNEPVKIEDLELSVDNEGQPPSRILIPQAEIDLEVKIAKVVDGYWEVFPDSAGWGEGSGFPGQTGNQVIFAHARKGLFANLRQVEVGDSIYVLSQDEYFAYKVSEIKEVLPGQTEVIAKTEEETLTLYTCSGFADSKRLIVTAKPL